MYVDGRVIVGESCPAAHEAKGPDIGDITTHNFVFSVNDGPVESGGMRIETEIFGYFQPELTDDEDWTDDLVDTAVLTVPIDSPVAVVAHEIEADVSGDKIHLVGEKLRRLVMECPCVTCDECPALNIISLYNAMEAANNRAS